MIIAYPDRTVSTATKLAFAVHSFNTFPGGAVMTYVARQLIRAFIFFALTVLVLSAWHGAQLHAQDTARPRAILGITVRNVTEEERSRLKLTTSNGAEIADINEGSPASYAGLAANDIVISLDGLPVVTAEQLKAYISQLSPGLTITLCVIREGRKLFVPVRLGEQRESPNDSKGYAENRVGKGDLHADHHASVPTQESLSKACARLLNAHKQQQAITERPYTGAGSDLLREADMHYNAEEYSRALVLYRQAANAGQAKAMLRLGSFYDYGCEVDQSDATALMWYRKAADFGSVDAMFNVAVTYQQGQGVPRDYAEALRWYEKAAAAGDAQSMTNIGLFYHKGEGVPRDYARAHSWYRKAAALGDSFGMYDLGVDFELGEGVPRDYSIALGWLQKAADSGRPEAMTHIGFMYATGHAVSQNDGEAMGWYMKAAGLGEPFAMDNIGKMYAEGNGVLKSEAMAILWFTKSASLGNVPAMCDLGAMYLEGRGADRNYSEAMLWLIKAADSGNPEAMNDLGVMFENGDGVPIDMSSADAWYQRAAALGDEVAKKNLAKAGTAIIEELLRPESPDDH